MHDTPTIAQNLRKKTQMQMIADMLHRVKTYASPVVNIQCRNNAVRIMGKTSPRSSRGFPQELFEFFTNETDVKQTCGPWTWA
jgi:hypothetical protein